MTNKIFLTSLNSFQPQMGYFYILLVIGLCVAQFYEKAYKINVQIIIYFNRFNKYKRKNYQV